MRSNQLLKGIQPNNIAFNDGIPLNTLFRCNCIQLHIISFQRHKWSNIIFSGTLNGLKFNSTIQWKPTKNNEGTILISLNNIVPFNDTVLSWRQCNLFKWTGLNNIEFTHLIPLNTIFRWDYIQLLTWIKVHKWSNTFISGTLNLVKFNLIIQ